MGVLAPILALLLAAAPAQVADLDRDATAAYRAGDHATASALWLEALAQETAPAERARLAYNLGNAAYRGGRLLEAVGWYTASLRHAPRDRDVLANLELARSEAGLEPADRGDLSSTLERLVSGLTRAEAEWLLAAAIAALGALLAMEALRGGSWRIAAGCGLAGVLLASAPLCWQVTRPEHPMLVVDAQGTAGRSEPRTDAKSLERLAAGTVVEREDALPGWVRVRSGGKELWVRERDVFDLVR